MEIANTWDEIDLPILLACAQATMGGNAADVELIAQIADQSEDTVVASLCRLKLVYINTDEMAIIQEGPNGFEDVPNAITVRGLTEKGLRVAGAWPSPEATVEELLKSIDEEIKKLEVDSPMRGKWVALRDSVLNLGAGTGANVLGPLILNALGQ
ncbi:hypothetical protein SAMN02910418_01600 [Bowdeniella nasicola]|uniref:Uncharacterized protein n=1 Tax=Bowdeniella nasicola TaxID=208480 RepID=A0A1H4B7X5_9ACTO|nr:hypothetical protein [Bowdeniella nasicola]SEA44197.1 hypothetical protein SAMN02910418_01600 [Bowdeniella nasicola]